MIYKYIVRLYMIIKPSLKYFKTQKTKFGLSTLKQETILYQNIFIHSVKYNQCYSFEKVKENSFKARI